MHEIKLSTIMDKLWNWLQTGRNRPAIKDTTGVTSVKYDFFLDSSVSDPLSFSIFELSDKGELLIDDVAKLTESKAAFFLFVNPEKQFVVAVKNNLENCKRLIQGGKVDNMKVKIVT